MKTLLIIYSGTGNTLSVAGLYQQYLGNTDIYRISVNSGALPDLEEYDLIGFGYPIHGFNAPMPFVHFLKTLPSVKGKKSFLFKTSGEGLHLNDGSSQFSWRILKRKGFDVMSERHIVMPYNMIYRHTDGMAKQMWIYAKAMVHLHSKEILAKKQEKIRQPIYKTWYVPLFRIEWYFARLHGRLFKVDQKKCIKCGKCVRSCPAGNIIERDGCYRFGGKCDLCMACSFGCPKNAISVGIFKYWKVNGSYHVELLANDETIKFPYIDGTEKGIYKIYRKYYRECDNRLKHAGMSINDYV